MHSQILHLLWTTRSDRQFPSSTLPPKALANWSRIDEIIDYIQGGETPWRLPLRKETGPKVFKVHHYSWKTLPTFLLRTLHDVCNSGDGLTNTEWHSSCHMLSLRGEMGLQILSDIHYVVCGNHTSLNTSLFHKLFKYAFQITFHISRLMVKYKTNLIENTSYKTMHIHQGY